VLEEFTHLIISFSNVIEEKRKEKKRGGKTRGAPFHPIFGVRGSAGKWPQFEHLKITHNTHTKLDVTKRGFSELQKCSKIHFQPGLNWKS